MLGMTWPYLTNQLAWTVALVVVAGVFYRMGVRDGRDGR